MKAHEIHNVAELIKALRNCSSAEGKCAECAYKSRVFPGTCNGCKWEMMHDAADALEAADEKIADYTAAIDALDDSNDAYIKENERLKKRIKELEAQLPKEGEWIEVKDWLQIPQEDSGTYRCSACGQVMKYPWSYCPNCGAKMKTVTDSHTLEEGKQE